MSNSAVRDGSAWWLTVSILAVFQATLLVITSAATGYHLSKYDPGST